MTTTLLEGIAENLRPQGTRQPETVDSLATGAGDLRQPFDAMLAATLAASVALPAPPTPIAPERSVPVEESPQPATSAPSSVLLDAASRRSPPPAFAALRVEASPAVDGIPSAAPEVASPGTTPESVAAPAIGAASVSAAALAAGAPLAADVVPAIAVDPAIGVISEAAVLPKADAVAESVPVPAADATTELRAAPEAGESSGGQMPGTRSGDRPDAPAATATRTAATRVADPPQPAPLPDAPSPIAVEQARARLHERNPAAKASFDGAPIEAAAVDAKRPALPETSPPRTALEVPQLAVAGESAPPDASDTDTDTDGRAASQRHGGAALPGFAKQDERSFGEMVLRARPAHEVAVEPAPPAAPAPAPHAAVEAARGVEVAAPIAADPIVHSSASSDRATQPAMHPPAEAVAARVEWLAERGGGTARVRLDPPSLGEIEIEVRVRGGVAEVVLHTSEHATHTILAGERAAVTQILAARDVRVDGFTVVHEPTPRDDLFSGGRDEQAPRDASGQADEGGGQGDRPRPDRALAGGPIVAGARPHGAPARPQGLVSRLDLRV